MTPIFENFFADTGKKKTPKDKTRAGKQISRRDFLKIFGAGAAAAGVLSACGPAEWILAPEKKEKMEQSLETLTAENIKRHDAGEIKTKEDLTKMFLKIKEVIPDFEQHLQAYKSFCFDKIKVVQAMFGLLLSKSAGFVDEKTVCRLLNLSTESSQEQKEAALKTKWEFFLQEFEKNFEHFIEGIFIWSGAIFDHKNIKEIMEQMVASDLTSEEIMSDMQIKIVNGLVQLNPLSYFYHSFEAKTPLKNTPLAVSTFILTNDLLPNLKQSSLGLAHANFIASQTVLDQSSIGYIEHLPLVARESTKVSFELPHSHLLPLIMCIMGAIDLTLAQKFSLLQGKNLNNLKKYFKPEKMPSEEEYKYDYGESPDELKNFFEKYMAENKDLFEQISNNKIFLDDIISMFSGLYKFGIKPLGLSLPLNENLDKVFYR